VKTLQTRTTVDNPDIFNYSSFGLFHPLREAWLPRSDTWRPGIKLGLHGCTPLFHGCPQRCQNYPKIGLLHSNLTMFLPTSSKRKPLGLQVFDPQPDDPDECGSGYWKDVGVFEPHDVEAAVQLWAVWSHGIPHFLIGKWRTTPIHTIGMYPIYHCVFFTLTIRTHQSGKPSRGNSGTGRRGNWGTCHLLIMRYLSPCS
jgi:hypothetical protein